MPKLHRRCLRYLLTGQECPRRDSGMMMTWFIIPSTLAMRSSVFLEGVGLHHVGAWSLRSILEDKENTVTQWLLYESSCMVVRSVCMCVVGLVCERVQRWHFLLLCGDDCRKGVAWASVPMVGVCACAQFFCAWVAFCVAASEFLVTTSIYKTK